ncbi:MAG: hypothetical protein J1E06_11065, partial [Acutalibacter sp.]|nr:hypothetical protein [Acutalibacter sp.]
MFLLTEVKYQLFRNKWRSVLMVCIALLLLGAMAFYLGNIQSNQAALRGLAENVPVTVRITSRDGSNQDTLNIDTAHFDGLSGGGVHHILCSSSAAGAYEPDARRETGFDGGDTTILGVNCSEALEISEDFLHYESGYDASLFGGEENLCLVHESYARKHDIAVGDEITLSFYSLSWYPGGATWSALGEATLRVAGTCSVQDLFEPTSLYVPVAWLRKTTEQANIPFTYNNFSAELDDPMKLGEFKEMLPKLGFIDPFEDAKDRYTGDAVSVEDELFVKTAIKLRENIRVFQTFLIPFFLLSVLLSALAAFLLLRSGRRDIALARSLGRPKAVSGTVHFLGVLFADLVGC